MFFGLVAHRSRIAVLFAEIDLGYPPPSSLVENGAAVPPCGALWVIVYIAIPQQLSPDAKRSRSGELRVGCRHRNNRRWGTLVCRTKSGPHMAPRPRQARQQMREASALRNKGKPSRVRDDIRRRLLRSRQPRHALLGPADWRDQRPPQTSRCGRLRVVTSRRSAIFLASSMDSP